MKNYTYTDCKILAKKIFGFKFSDTGKDCYNIVNNNLYYTGYENKRKLIHKANNYNGLYSFLKGVEFMRKPNNLLNEFWSQKNSEFGFIGNTYSREDLKSCLEKAGMETNNATIDKLLNVLDKVTADDLRLIISQMDD